MTRSLKNLKNRISGLVSGIVYWNIFSLFEYKLSSEATYAYILQIFLVMIKKGRIKEFNTAEIRGKVTLKAEYSINL